MPATNCIRRGADPVGIGLPAITNERGVSRASRLSGEISLAVRADRRPPAAAA